MNIWGKEHRIDKLFSKKLKEYSLENPEHLWEGIESKLQANKSTRYIWFGSWLNNIVLLLSFGAATATGVYFLNVYSNSKAENKELKTKDTPAQVAETGIEGSNNGGVQHLLDLNQEGKYTESNNKQVVQEGRSIKYLKNNNLFGSKQTAFGKQQSSNKKNVLVVDDGMLINLLGIDYSEGIENTQTDLLLNNSTGQISADRVNEFFPIKTKRLFVKGYPLSWKNDLNDGCAIKRPERTKFYLDVIYAPEVSQKSIKPLKDSDRLYATERANSERFIMANSFGVRGSMVFPTGMALRMGFVYSNTEERFDFVKERQEIMKIIKDPNNVPIDTITDTIVIIDKIYNHYTFYDIPIMVGYEFDLKDFILTINGGIGINLAAGQKGKIYSPDLKATYDLSGSKDGSYTVFNRNAGLSICGSFGLNYKISEKWSILAEPSFRYYLKSFSDPSYPLSQRFNRFGLQAGVRFRIL